MFDRLISEYLNPDSVDIADVSSAAVEKNTYAQSNQQSRENRLVRREGKSATRTVKQAMAIQHLKALKNAQE